MSKRAKHGEPQQYLLDTFDTDTNDCLLWPYNISGDGYGKVLWKGKCIGAHRLALEFTKGKSKLFACHTCPNRHCYNPRHLYWGSSSDNAIDRTLDNHSPRGKLTDIQVKVILKDYRSTSVIAKEYGVSDRHIRHLRSRRSWSCITA